MSLDLSRVIISKIEAAGVSAQSHTKGVEVEGSTCEGGSKFRRKQRKLREHHAKRAVALLERSGDR